MQVLHSMKYIIHCAACIELLEFLVSFQLSEQGAFFHELQNQVEVLRVVEDAVQLEDVRMVEEHLHFELHDELVLYLALLDDRFLHFFQGEHHAGSPVHDHRNRTEPTLSQVLQGGEINQRRAGRNVFKHDFG